MPAMQTRVQLLVQGDTDVMVAHSSLTPLDCDLYVGNEALSRMLAERLGSGNASAASERADGEGEIARARSQARPLVETSGREHGRNHGREHGFSFNFLYDSLVVTWCSFADCPGTSSLASNGRATSFHLPINVRERCRESGSLSRSHGLDPTCCNATCFNTAKFWYVDFTIISEMEILENSYAVLRPCQQDGCGTAILLACATAEASCVCVHRNDGRHDVQDHVRACPPLRAHAAAAHRKVGNETIASIFLSKDALLVCRDGGEFTIPTAEAMLAAA